MMTNGDKKARVMQQFPWTLEFTVYDLVMMHQLSREVVARVELDTLGSADDYPGMRVTIINKVTGKVDSKYFNFNDYFTGTSKVTNPEAAKDRGFYVWRQGWDWYLNYPDKKSLTDLYEKARKHVHTDATLLVRQYAAMDTVENLGQNVQSLFLRFFRPMDPQHALGAAYDMIAGESAGEGIPVDDEFRESVKDGRAALARVQQKGLPLTVENLDHAYMGTGPFEKAKKGGKAKSKAK